MNEQTKDAGRRMVVRRCPFCREEVTCGAGQAVGVCAGCHAVQHEECWTESGACGSCGGTRRLEAVRDPLTPAIAERLLVDAGYEAREVQALLRGVGRGRAQVLQGLVAALVALGLVVGAWTATRAAPAVGSVVGLKLPVPPGYAAFENGGEATLKVFVGQDPGPDSFVASVEPGERQMLWLDTHLRGGLGPLSGCVQVGEGPLIPFTARSGERFVYEDGQLGPPGR